MIIDTINETSRFDYVVVIEKFNPYHDAKGRFANANSAASAGSGKLDIEKLKGTESADRGKASADGSMKTAIVYHGSYSEFDEFDHNAIGGKNQVNQYGEGFYFADTPEQARLYGDHVYAVELSYSTDRRTAKRTGRTQDFQYSEDTGIWMVPYESQNNAKIVGIADGKSEESMADGFQKK